MERIYLFIAVPASLILLIQTSLTFLGLSGEIEADFDGDGDVNGSGESGITLFSVRNLVAFFTFFGWGGLWLKSMGVAPVFTVLGSILLGMLFMLISTGLFFIVSKMQRSGNIDLNNAIGKLGEVYIPIPGKRRRPGKVNIIIQGALREVEAYTDEHEDLKTGSTVQVIAVESGAILVVKKYEHGGNTNAL